MGFKEAIITVLNNYANYYYPADGSNELLLVEKWRDADALQEHGQQAHFKRLGQLKSDYVLETLIEKYEN